MVLAAVLGLVGALVYGTFLEWFIHRFVMHTSKISRLAFDRHAIAHHTERRSLKAFYASPEEEYHYEIGESSFVPVLWFLHLPIFFVVWRFISIPAAITLATGGLLYLIAYEVLHFYIHAPRNYLFQRTRLFRFYCEYHRLHHHKARVNYNVVMPLADLILRTFSMESMRPEPSAPDYVCPDTGPKTAFRKASRV
jgi:hypothetical protein